MPRALHERWIISGELLAHSPICIGAAERQEQAEINLATNGRGDYYLPGSSLTGVLRQWCEQHFPHDLDTLKHLWGYQAPPNSDGLIEGSASYITVDDAPIANPRDISPEILDGIAIDRYSHSTAHNFKYQRQILPRGTRFTLRLHIDVPDAKDVGSSYIAALIQALLPSEEGTTSEPFGLRIGGASGKGFGRIALAPDTLCVMHENWHDAAAFVEQLFSDQEPPCQNAQFLQTQQRIAGRYRTPSQLSLRVHWSPDGPLMVKDAGEGDTVKHYPLSSQSNTDQRALLLPGSSIKGAFRSHAERIVRTLLDRDIEPESTFESQISLPLVNEIFGIQRDNTTVAGCLKVESSYSQERFGHRTWQTLTNDPNARLEGQEPHFQLSYHNAIGRWMGNAADQRLFTQLEPRQIQWEPLVLTLDLQRLGVQGDERLQNVALCMLALLLNELEQQRFCIGFGSNRGFGKVHIQHINCQLDNPDPDLPPLDAHYHSAAALLQTCQQYTGDKWRAYWQSFTAPQPPTPEPEEQLA